MKVSVSGNKRPCNLVDRR